MINTSLTRVLVPSQTRLDVTLRPLTPSAYRAIKRPMRIYKILRAEEWAELKTQGQTQGASIDISDGFVHFSTADQARETAAKHFAGEQDLQLLAYEANDLGDPLKWEVSRGGALFPHLYAPLSMDDLRWHAPLPLIEGTHRFPDEMSWTDDFIDPDRAQFEAFKALPRDSEVQMLNLVRFRKIAAYPDGHALKGTSGAEAYAAYGTQSAPIFTRVGGTILWRGNFETTLIGPYTEAWDAMFIARYPSAAAFLDMVTDANYQRAVIHRQAAVETSRLIRCGATEGGETFA